MTTTAEIRGFVRLVCRCGAELKLPPRAAAAAREPWLRIHSGKGHALVSEVKVEVGEIKVEWSS